MPRSSQNKSRSTSHRGTSLPSWQEWGRFLANYVFAASLTYFSVVIVTADEVFRPTRPLSPESAEGAKTRSPDQAQLREHLPFSLQIAELASSPDNSDDPDIFLAHIEALLASGQTEA